MVEAKQIAIIQEEIESLSGTHMSIVQLYYFSDFSFDEISYILGMQIEQVEMNYNHINNRIHSALIDEGFEGETSHTFMDMVIQAFENIALSCELTVEKSVELYNKIIDSSKDVIYKLSGSKEEGFESLLKELEKEETFDDSHIYDFDSNDDLFSMFNKRELRFSAKDTDEYLVRFSRGAEVRHIKGFKNDISLLQKVLFDEDGVKLVLENKQAKINTRKSYAFHKGITYLLDDNGRIRGNLRESFTVHIYDEDYN